MIRIIQYGIAITLGFAYLTIDVNSQLVNSFCLILILLFGIPHGAVDHRIHLSTSKDTSVLKYILRYVLIAAGYILWWLLDPTKALFIFILLSAYHFGQELLEDNKIKNSDVWMRMIWGLMILVAPMIYHIESISGYLNVVTQGELPDFGFWRYIVPSAIILFAIGSILLFKRRGIEKKSIHQLSAFLGFIIIIHVLLPFVLAFTLYFVLFHSLNAFKHQYKWLKSKKSNYDISRFAGDLVGFSLLAILGILSLLWFLKPESQTTLITYFFILISLITLPHAITLDQFYRFRSQPRLSGGLK
ncbi:Brp/Blh family beta-carotene 15,15'-dioxygenase [Ekhidna sp.]|uniref:Brp/Blh family beta-carotene 15,15'-dioxygenase n=1 Tax=Ekhidna sp. TaxID=2608089 RepID=UPI003CCB9E27